MGSCFVIMGFGEKTDFQSNPQRVLNLNRTYEDIIKPAVKDTGHICVRADEIIHSTVIDKPMYDNLLSADLVIADLSTALSTRCMNSAFVTRCGHNEQSCSRRRISASRSISIISASSNTSTSARRSDLPR